MRALLKGMPAEAKKRAGQAVAQHVKTWLSPLCFGQTLNIALFDSMACEIDTAPLDNVLIGLSVERYVPFINQEDRLCFVSLEKGQPICVAKRHQRPNPYDLDIIFVPGLAFDQLGHRLGRGKGYYDKALAEAKSQAAKTPILVGLAMDEQIVTQIPAERHDIPMDYLCTETFGMRKISRSSP